MTLHRTSLRKLNQRAATLMLELKDIRTELLRRETRKCKTAEVVVERTIIEIVKRKAA